MMMFFKYFIYLSFFLNILCGICEVGWKKRTP